MSATPVSASSIPLPLGSRREPALPAREHRRSELSTPVGSEPISRFEVPEPQSLGPELRELYTEFEATHGFIPHWLQALSVNPGTALRLAQLYRQLFDPRRSRLSAADRQLLAVVSSSANRCSYSVLNHTRALGEALEDPVRAQRIALDHHLVRLSKREQVLADVAEKLTRDPTRVGNEELDRLRQAGFDEASALEVIEIAAFFNYANRLTIALNVLPDQQFFAH